MSNIYIDITQITHRLITALGKNSKGVVEAGKLEPFMVKYMDLTDKMYTSLYKKRFVDVADVKDFASGEMTAEAELLCTYFAYWTFFEDNYGNAIVLAASKTTSDVMYKAYEDFKKKWESLYNKMTKFDITNESDDLVDFDLGVMDREGFK